MISKIVTLPSGKKLTLIENKPVKSWRKDKKFVVLAVKGNQSKVIHFGYASMLDYTQHRDKKRRENYLSRSAGIRNKDGELTKDDIFSANFWSRTYLWKG